MKSRTAILSIKDLKSEALPALKQALGAVPGVQSIDFSVERSVAVVEFEGEHTIVDDLMRAVLKAGYQLI
ncbi:MAG TPA: heavy-metal-associated domain-containing protein [Candidatus Binatia bacterium]|jgi:copper chaperone CopZ